jgi:hypothetical protein
MSRLFSAVIATAAIWSTQANADILSGVQVYHCVAQGDAHAVSDERVFEVALAQYGLTPTDSERTAAVTDDPPWSDFAEAILAVRERARQNLNSLEGIDRRRGELYLALDNFLNERDVSTLAHVRLTNAPQGSVERVRQFLMRRSDAWLDVTCTMPKREDTSDRDDEQEPPALVTYLRGARIARDLAGAQADALKNRTFATLEGRRDEETDQDRYSFEGLVLFPALWEHSPNDRREGAFDAALQPYLGFQRAESENALKEINDLTFGLVAPFNIDGTANSWLPAAHYFTVSADWETDDSFESSVTRAEVTYTPTWGGRFNDERRGPCGFGRCSWLVSAVADFAEIGEAADKPSLANMEQYGRVGANVFAGVYIGPPNGWEVSLTGDYRLRDAFTEDDGDAQLLKIRFAYAPSDISNVSFGLDYVRGEDLTSLNDQDYWALSIGFRR